MSLSHVQSSTIGRSVPPRWSRAVFRWAAVSWTTCPEPVDSLKAASDAASTARAIAAGVSPSALMASSAQVEVGAPAAGLRGRRRRWRPGPGRRGGRRGCGGRSGPGRMTAGSRESRSLVAAMTMSSGTRRHCSTSRSSSLTVRRASWFCRGRPGAGRWSRTRRRTGCRGCGRGEGEGPPQVAGRLAGVGRHHVGRRDVDEVEAELAGRGPGDERLAHPRRAVEQEAVPAQPVGPGLAGEGQHEAEGVLQLGLQGVHAADVGEGGQVGGALHVEGRRLLGYGRRRRGDRGRRLRRRGGGRRSDGLRRRRRRCCGHGSKRTASGDGPDQAGGEQGVDHHAPRVAGGGAGAEEPEQDEAGEDEDGLQGGPALAPALDVRAGRRGPATRGPG